MNDKLIMPEPSSTASNWLANGIIEKNGISFIAGDEPKNNIEAAMWIGYCLAIGAECCGRDVKSAASVLYIGKQAEKDMNLIAKMVNKYGNKGGNITVADKPLNLLNSTQVQEFIINCIQLNDKPSLIVLELSNHQYDDIFAIRNMAQVILTLDLIRRSTGAALLLIQTESGGYTRPGFRAIYNMANAHINLFPTNPRHHGRLRASSSYREANFFCSSVIEIGSIPATSKGTK